MAKKGEAFTQIPKRDENFSEWYTAVALRAELADYTPVRGFMAIRPYGYALWEGIQAWLDRKFKATGHMNAYFPLLVPESLLQKEAEHVEGFAPQVAWVTHGGDEKLSERLAVRPTSEAIILPMYAKWIQSYRDLPLLLLQWNSVVRWEKSTRLFLRTAEFLWHEGHTAHRTAEDADAECRLILNIYRELLEEVLAIPVLIGTKPPSQRFAGADTTYTLEALMPDGQAIQAGTSHFLGQNFAKAFEVKFLDSDNQEKYIWSTSWAVTTRLIGTLVLAHGDDRGLVLPPRIAPYQVVIVPILGKDDAKVLAAARELVQTLSARVRVKLDDRDTYTPGWKFHEWELRGVPVRLEVGPRDVAARQVTLVRRIEDSRSGSGRSKQAVATDQVVGVVEKVLDDLQADLLARGTAYRDSHTTTAETVDEVVQALQSVRGFVKVRWCESPECEQVIQEKTGASPRVIPLEERVVGRCVVCGRPAKVWVYYARAY
jgi:prolyl-tRNA synthetase